MGTHEYPQHMFLRTVENYHLVIINTLLICFTVRLTVCAISFLFSPSDEDSDVEDLQHKTGDYLSKSASLPKGVLQIKQCTDLNKDYPLKVDFTIY